MKKLTALLKRIPVLSYVLVGLFIILIIIACIIGIDTDRGVLVGWLGVIFLLTEITRRWRKEWHFLLLVVGAIVFSIILSCFSEAVVYPLVEKAGGEAALQSRGLEIFHQIVASTLTLVPVIAIIYGILGAITLFVLRLIILCRKRFSEKT
ncbi:MAG: hypothetical protein JXA17_06555 [Dehalococcoidales bacterium]|nr:hypothetical protein [Dehalococcoidales bacterium]